MKRLAIALAIIILTLLFPWFYALAQSTQLSHVNPATVKSSPDSSILLLQFGNLFNLASLKEYRGAQDTLNELRQAYIPDELRYIVDHYADLCQELIQNLDKLESTLNKASTLLSNNKINETKQAIDEAQAIIPRSESLLQEVEAATNSLGEKFGVFTLKSSSLTQSYQRLTESLNRLMELLDQFNQLRLSLTAQLEDRQVLLPTNIDLTVNPSFAFVGDDVLISGKLSTSYQPLEDREVDLILGDMITAVKTADDGSYQVNLKLPYVYEPDITLVAEYTPSGNDKTVYQASKSLVHLELAYEVTFLSISTPETCQPGLPFTISGEVSPGDNNQQRSIKVLLDDLLLAYEITGGRFNIEVVLPGQIMATGTHNITIIVPAEERYSSATKKMPIEVVKLPLQAELEVPKVMFAPGKLSISGSVRHGQDTVESASVSIRLANSLSKVSTSPGGIFSVPVTIPFNFSLISIVELGVNIEPNEVWYDTLEIKRRIFIINPIGSGMALAMLSVLALVVSKKGKRATAKAEPVAPETPPQSNKSIKTPLPEPRYQPTGLAGKIISAYWGSLELMEKYSGASMEPYSTISEFAREVSRSTSAGAILFQELSKIAEIALYSSQDPDDKMVSRAEELAAMIRKELHDRPA